MGKRAGELLRSLLVLVLVTGATGLALAGLDAVPGWMQGVPRGVRRVRTIDEAERRLRVRLALPGYFPDTLRWPPAAVRLVYDPPAVALSFEGRAGGEELQLAQGTGGDGPIPSALWPEVTVLQQSTLAVGRAEGTLARIVGDDGSIWLEIDWVAGGRRLALRGKGSLEELLRMARSTRREGP